MIPFSSDRERRLWLWALVVVGAIYSTLGPAQLLADTFRERNLLRVTMAGALIVIAVFVGRRFVRRRPDLPEIGVMICVVIAYGLAWIRVNTPEERTHLIEYTLVAILIHKALLERRANGHPVPAPAALALLSTVALGWADEGIQWLLPNRVYDIRDVAFNILAAVMAISARLALARAGRSRSGKNRECSSRGLDEMEGDR